MISCEDVFGRAGSERLGLHSTIVTIESGEALSEHLPVALRSVDFEPMFQRCSSIAEWVATKPDAAASLVVVIQTPHGNASDLGESIAALKQYSAHPQFVIMSVSDEPGCVLEALLHSDGSAVPCRCAGVEAHLFRRRVRSAVEPARSSVGWRAAQASGNARQGLLECT